MPLNFQHLPVKIVGLDQKVDDVNSMPGQLQQANNLEMDKTGRVSKRNGFDPYTLPAGKTIGYDGIASFNGGLEGAAAGLKAAFYAVGAWAPVSFGNTQTDYAQNEDVAETLLSDGGSLYVQSHDPSSRKIFATSSALTGNPYVARVVEADGKLWQLYSNGGFLYVRVTDGTTVNTYQIGGAGEISASNQFCDGESTDNDSHVCFVYNDGSGNFVAVIASTAAPATWNKYTVNSGVPCSAPPSLSTTGTKAGTQYFYVCYADTAPDLYSRRIATDGTVSAACTVTTSYAAGDHAIQAGDLVMFWDKTGPSSGPSVYATTVYDASNYGGNATASESYVAMIPAGRSWRDASYRYWIVQNFGIDDDITNQAIAVLRTETDGTSGEIIGVFYDGFSRWIRDGAGFGSISRPVCGVFNQRRIYGAGDYPEKIQQTMPKFIGTWVLQLVEFSTRSTVQYAESGDDLYFLKDVSPQRTNGILFPNVAAYPIDNEVKASGGSMTASSTYQYVMTWVYYDELGIEYESAPSVVKSVSLGAGETQVTFTFWSNPWLHDGNITRYRYRIYRTVSDGSLFYRLFEGAVSAPSTTYVDQAADALLTVNPVLLYTESGEIPNRGAPATSFLLQGNDRMWAISAEDNSIWFWKPGTNNLAPHWNVAFRVDLETKGTPTALAELDEKILVFTENEVFLIIGEGPDRLGQGSFSTQKLPHTVGCRDPYSVLTTEYGVFFMSEKGIHVIDRGLNLQYIGAQVEDYNSNTVLAAIALDERNEVWFAQASRILVFDTFHRIWFTHTGLTIQDMVVHDNVPTISTGSAIWQEGSAIYQDNSVNYSTVFETGWIAFAQLAGFARIRKMLFPVSGRKGCTIEVWYDNDDSAAAAETFTVADAATNWFEIEVKPQLQKCESIKLKITHTGSTSGLVLHGVTFEVGLKGGSNRLPDANRTEGT